MTRRLAAAARHGLVGLPARDPRWLVPSTAGAAAFAFELNSPMRPLPRLAAGVIRRALRVRPGARLISRLGSEPSQPTCSRLDWAGDAMAALVRPSEFVLVGWTGRGRPFPKLVVAAVDAHGRALAFGKLAYTGETVVGLRYERDAIRFLASTPLAGQVPRELGSFERDGEFLLILSAVEGRRLTPGAPIDGRHLAVIRDLLDLPRPGWLRHAALGPRLAAINTAGTAPLPLGGLGSLAGTVDAAVSTDLFTFSHGDLAPWNCISGRGGLGLVDWEAAGVRPLAWDLFHYAAQVETLVHRSRPVTAGRRLVGDRWLASVRLLVEERFPRVWDALTRRLQQWYLLDTLLETFEYPSPSSRRAAAVRIAALDELERR